MNVNLLFQCFEGTLNQSGEVRNQAEQKLRELSKIPGFVGACLDILSNSEVPESVKLSTSLYLKNKIYYGWSKRSKSSNDLLNIAIDEDEKPVVKDMFINALVQCSHSNPNCVRMLLPALTTIVEEEYPQGRWDGLLAESFRLLSTNDIDSAYVGLLALSEIFRTFRWSENDERQNLERLIVQHFDDLLAYANQLIQSPNALDDNKIGSMLKLIVKIYKFITYHDFPHTLQTPERFIPWANFHVAIIEIPLSNNFLESVDKESRKNYQWVKAKKWAYSNMLRLFQRYASESLTRKFSYDEFKQIYLKDFLPNLLQLYFQQIEQWGASKLWLSDECLYNILSYIEHTLTQKVSWLMVKPHYATILQHIVFPILSPDSDTLETFENDPREYIHRHLETWNDDYSPDVAAVSLLVTAVHKRSKTTLEPTLTFVTETLNAIKSSSNEFQSLPLEQAVKVESCLRIISNITDRLTSPKSPYGRAMEVFLHAYVFPFFNSEYGFLRARVCELCSKLSDYEFVKDNSVPIIYEGVMHCFNDESGFLPVKLLAAFALQSFVDNPVFRESLSTIVVPTMQSLLQLSNEFESDVISGVIREFVEQFSRELQPFSVDLTNNLVQQFLKLAIELNDASNVDINTFSGGDLPDESDKEMAALSILSTIISILLSFENSTEIIESLEQSFYPAAEFILLNDMENFYREVCEFVENSTFLLRKVSPISWKVLELIGDCNRKEDSMVAFHLEDFMMAISNYLIYGKQELKQNQFYTNILFEIYQTATANDNEDKDLDEMCVVFEFAQKMTLAFGDKIPEQYLSTFLTTSANAIEVEKDGLKTHLNYGVNAFNVILASIVHYPSQSLNFLHHRQLLTTFLEIWIQFYLPKFTRVIDIKLSIMATLSLLTQVPVQEYSSLQIEAVYLKLGPMLNDLFSRLPVALKALQDKRQEFSSDAFGKFDDFDSEWNDYESDDEDAADDAEEYLKFLNGEANGLHMVHESGDFLEQDDMDELEEDPLSGSVLDDVNVYELFQLRFSTLQQTDPEKYQNFVNSMSLEDQQSFVRTLNAK
ncbi:unnamed protein product [Kluyveromyces dobzhanskii CBS 2104]|uniref:WGS project CCBQ000000000 data, contig 00016 n=1 Tax=Kluyveromyces dobzhanskii CBS 2104 TaxID=1427455 RepID=A0A0A8KZP6_9SACH|nr:unnamed protein product [Kluyveromyces dobzhanskii CBS 2104]